MAEPAPEVSGQSIPADVASLIAEIQAKPVYEHATWGIHLEDASHRRDADRSGRRKMLPPGSIMKIYSSPPGSTPMGRIPLPHPGLPHRRGHGRRARRRPRPRRLGRFQLRTARPGRTGRSAFNSLPEIDHNSHVYRLSRRCDCQGQRSRLPPSTRSPPGQQGRHQRVDGDVAIDDRLFDTYQRMERWADRADLGERERHRHPRYPGRVLASRRRSTRVRRRAAIAVEASQDVATTPRRSPSTVRPGVVKVTGEIAAGGSPPSSSRTSPTRRHSPAPPSSRRWRGPASPSRPRPADRTRRNSAGERRLIPAT